MIKRRTLLECAVRLASMPVGVQFFSSWMEAAQTTGHSHTEASPDDQLNFENYQPKFFEKPDFDALCSITELLIPTDETPGAREAHCAEFIDFVVYSSQQYAPETAQQWRAAMASLQAAGFHSADTAHRAMLLADIAKPESDRTSHHPAFTAYRLIKRENTFAFYTARAGIIDALDYRGNTYNLVFPACTHPEHHEI